MHERGIYDTQTGDLCHTNGGKQNKGNEPNLGAKNELMSAVDIEHLRDGREEREAENV